MELEKKLSSTTLSNKRLYPQLTLNNESKINKKRYYTSSIKNILSNQNNSKYSTLSLINLKNNPLNIRPLTSRKDYLASIHTQKKFSTLFPKLVPYYINPNTNTISDVNSISNNKTVCNILSKYEKKQRKNKLISFMRNTMREKNEMSKTQKTNKSFGFNMIYRKDKKNNTQMNFYGKNYGNKKNIKLRNIMNLKELHLRFNKRNTESNIKTQSNKWDKSIFNNTFYTSVNQKNQKSNNNNDENYVERETSNIKTYNNNISNNTESKSLFKLRLLNANNNVYNINNEESTERKIDKEREKERKLEKEELKLFSKNKKYLKNLYRDIKINDLMKEVSKFEQSNSFHPNQQKIEKNKTDNEKFISKRSKKIQGFKGYLSKNKIYKNEIQSKLKSFINDISYITPPTVNSPESLSIYNELNNLQKISDRKKCFIVGTKKNFSFDKTKKLLNEIVNQDKNFDEEVNDYLKGETLDFQRNIGDFIFYKGKGLFAENALEIKKAEEVLSLGFDDLKRYCKKNLSDKK